MNLKEYFHDRLKNLSHREIQLLNEDVNIPVSHVFDPDIGPESGAVVKIIGDQYKIMWQGLGDGRIYSIGSLITKNIYVKGT